MGRRKHGKYDLAEESSVVKAVKWRAGDYFRISREDGDKEESDSIKSQKELAKFFHKTHPDISVVEDYTDDGWSGTNFERPRFLDMIDDIKRGHINCVIVKDLSRFGRNYIEVGRYLEMIFPMLNVRFISINDNIDSVGNPESVNNAIVAFKNIMNDEYCRDISNKVRSVLTNKRKQGKFIGSFASYGYLKDENDHNKLIVDPDVAPIIQDIFHWFLSGMGVISIAKKLNELGVPNPSTYKRLKGMNYQHPQHDKNDTLWPDSSVKRILKNRLYVGDMVQGKYKIRSYKLQVSVPIPEEEWIIVENTHEAIIDRATFEQAQDIFARDCRKPPNKHRCYVLSGFVRCADCKRAMNRKLISQPYADYGYYVCSTFKKMNQEACTKHTIRSDKLERAVLETIKAQVDLAVSLDEVLSALKEKNATAKHSRRLEAAFSERDQELKRIKLLKIDLYPDYKNGLIDRDEYDALKCRFESQMERLEEEKKHIQEEIAAYENVIEEENAFLNYFLAHKNIQSLTREVVVELIEMIYVHEGGEITIKFRYQDEYLRLIDLIKEQGGEIPSLESAS